jgi:hypothetical protein
MQEKEIDQPLSVERRARCEGAHGMWSTTAADDESLPEDRFV